MMDFLIQLTSSLLKSVLLVCLSFWDYALESAACILNMVLTKKVDKTPYEVWHGQAPKQSYLKVWGCEALDILSTTHPRTKFFVARFFENEVIDHEASGSLEDLEIIQEGDTHHLLNTSLDHEEDDQEIDEPQSDIDPIRDLGKPANYKAALLDPESDKWLNAMNVEMQFMKDNEVWELVELPPSTKTVGHKWLFKKKTNMDGADIRAIRILIAIATFYDYEIWKMDVKTTFLNGYLNEEVYMEQPQENIEVEKILKRFYMENSKCGTIPMQEKLKLSKSQGASTPAEIQRMQNIPYASAVGSIMYVVRCTRPDVAFAQNITSRFQQNPSKLHWTIVKNILKYLRNTKDMFLVYGDAEYIAAFDASKEAVWIRKFISGLGVVPTIEEPINMYCDNTRAIAIAKDQELLKPLVLLEIGEIAKLAIYLEWGDSGEGEGCLSMGFCLVLQGKEWVNTRDVVLGFEKGGKMGMCNYAHTNDMLKAQIKVADILCELELIYRPALFDIMVHLVIHLPLEDLEGRPIRPWWMYLFERYMKKLKGYVRNKAKSEGLIAEGYVAEEALTFSSHYFRDVTMKFNRPDRNVDCPPPTCQF
ncbi:zinc finger, CCHC-type containing protein [Tanacetum coccineum]